MERLFLRKFCCLLLFVLFCAAFAQAGENLRVSHAVQVLELVAQDVSPPLRLIPPAPRPSGVMRIMPIRRIPPRVGTETSPESDALSESIEQDFPGAIAMPSTSVNFEGVGAGLAGYVVGSAPPDTNGDVGPNHFVQIVNTDYAVFNKATGAVIFGPVPINTLWASFPTLGGGCQNNNDGDPTVTYDQIADRWIISQFSVSTTPFLQCFAVSTSGDPTGSFVRYAFSFGNTDFNDYPKLGVWPDAYYQTYNIFGTTFTGRVCAFDRTKMIAGLAASGICFDDNGDGGLLPADLDGTTLPPANANELVMSFGFNSLNLYRFHVDFATPANSSLTGPINIPVASFVPACNGGTCIKEPKTTNLLDSLADRLMYRLAYRNFGTHESLVVNHSVRGSKKKRIGIRWYEIRDPNGTPTVFQQATYSPDAIERWMGSIAMDKQGNMALGFSVAKKKGTFPGVRYTGRLVTDPAGQMSQGESVLIDGTGSQLFNLSRWGDYSSINVDPNDDCTFWYTTEYLTTSGTFNWHTRIGAFKFPACN